MSHPHWLFNLTANATAQKELKLYLIADDSLADDSLEDESKSRTVGALRSVCAGIRLIGVHTCESQRSQNELLNMMYLTSLFMALLNGKD